MTNTTQLSGTRDYVVEGMTCAHCVLAVRDAVSDDVRAAVAEAGHEVAA